MIRFAEMFENCLIGANKIKLSLCLSDSLEIGRVIAIGFQLEPSSGSLGRLPGRLLMSSLQSEELAKRNTDSHRKQSNSALW